ncbi:hypothetical protein IMZ48_37805 [Candidatus Bathyarchaeota archaeon]|nr:hypothetical protein [Candidatus Bathyarchaeota archaeon]
MATDGRLPTLAVPGKILGPATHYHPGAGTHLHENNVVSSLLGRVTLSAAPRAGPAKRLNKITESSGSDELPTLSVARGGEARGEVLPDVGAVVLCRVIRLVTKQAIVSIQQVGGSVLETEWQGVIRSQDVRATEKDKVKIYESFRPGDTVRAQVVSCPLPFFPGYIWSRTNGMFPWLDISGRPGKLLPLHGVQRAGRYHGHERGRQRHGARELEGVQGPADGGERAEEGREAGRGLRGQGAGSGRRRLTNRDIEAPPVLLNSREGRNWVGQADMPLLQWHAHVGAASSGPGNTNPGSGEARMNMPPRSGSGTLMIYEVLGNAWAGAAPRGATYDRLNVHMNHNISPSTIQDR